MHFMDAMAICEPSLTSVNLLFLDVTTHTHTHTIRHTYRQSIARIAVSTKYGCLLFFFLFLISVGISTECMFLIVMPLIGVATFALHFFRTISLLSSDSLHMSSHRSSKAQNPRGGKQNNLSNNNESGPKYKIE